MRYYLGFVTMILFIGPDRGWLYNLVYWSVVFIFLCPHWLAVLIGRGIGWLLWHIRWTSPLLIYFRD